MSLHGWSWLFLIVYITAMAGFGLLGARRVASADDFATARGGYGPLLLALAFASTAASGATFLGLPGLTYTFGMSTLWIAFLYPIGIYLGIWICQRTIGRYGNLAGARSIPEYLGERYQSEALRVSVAIFSLILLFYLAGQLVAGLIMFETMLGLPQHWALAITTVVLLGYVTLGGAHADILTDGAQGLLMVVLAIGIAGMFFLGAGNGGFAELIASLRDQDPRLVAPLHPGAAITSSVWAFVSLTIAHIPLGLLPHIGNKLWALRRESERRQFIVYGFTFGMLLPAITLGGALARGRFGAALLEAGDANAALPALFIDIFPAWLAALLGIGILAAVMSTADGLVISTSQVFANDIYRRSLVPRLRGRLSAEALDRHVLTISRIVAIATMVGSAGLAWLVMDMNVVLLVWIGIGGFTAALAGPLVLGSIWDGVTRAGALAGFWTGALAFVAIHGGLVSGRWLEGTRLEHVGRWFDFNAASPYSAATLGGLIAVAVTVVVSLSTRPLPEAHLRRIRSQARQRP
ncbi:MAG TPA: sodium:pantothenate symporter [Gammaproteobacteria bacterium]|nr:sodium:pantothenate symporter [Gammaproteobacteria bacterium]